MAINRPDPFDAVAHALVEDMLALPDPVFLKEIEEEVGDAEAEARAARQSIARALMAADVKIGRAPKRTAHRRPTPSRPTLSRTELLAIIGRAVNDTGAAEAEITLAARQGDELTVEELQGIVEDLRELGALDADDDL